MKFVRRISKNFNTYKRFVDVYYKLEDIGYNIWLTSISGADTTKQTSRYRKNLKKVDELYKKWKT